MVVNSHRAHMHPVVQSYLKEQDHMPINGIDWKLVRAAAVPGPGAHNSHIRTGHQSDRLGGGGWNSHTGKVFHADAACKRTGTLPGPGEYAPQQGTFAYERVPGCSMDKAQAKSLTDQIVRRAKQMPGPNTYTVPTPNPLPEGGRISASKSKSFSAQVIRNAKDSPGADHYVLPEVHPPPGGNFSTGKPKSEIDWIIRRAKATPGPNEYTVTIPKSQIGGHMRQSDRPMMNVAIAKAQKRENKPGPGQYDPLSSFIALKRQGKLCGPSLAGRTGPAYLPPPFDKFGYSQADDKFAMVTKEKRFGPNMPRDDPPPRSKTSMDVKPPKKGRRAASEEPGKNKSSFFMTQ